jgi:hypothetical protein
METVSQEEAEAAREAEFDADPANAPAGEVKEWPDNDEQVMYEHLVDPVINIIRKNYKLASRKYKGVIYNGYNIGKADQACIPPPNIDLNPAGLEYHKERDRDLLDVCVRILFLLGMEQGRRDCARDHIHIEIKARYEALGNKWPPDRPSDEDMKRAGEAIAELIAKPSKNPVTKKKTVRKTKRK